MKETLGSRMKAARLGFRPCQELDRYVRIPARHEQSTQVVIELATAAGLPSRHQTAEHHVWWEDDGMAEVLGRLCAPHKTRAAYQQLTIPADTPTG